MSNHNGTGGAPAEGTQLPYGWTPEHAAAMHLQQQMAQFASQAAAQQQQLGNDALQPQSQVIPSSDDTQLQQQQLALLYNQLLAQSPGASSNPYLQNHQQAAQQQQQQYLAQAQLQMQAQAAQLAMLSQQHHQNLISPQVSQQWWDAQAQAGELRAQQQHQKKPHRTPSPLTPSSAGHNSGSVGGGGGGNVNSYLSQPPRYRSHSQAGSGQASPSHHSQQIAVSSSNGGGNNHSAAHLRTPSGSSYTVGGPPGSHSPSNHPTPLAVQPFIGGPGSVLLVENLDPIPLPPRGQITPGQPLPLVQLTPDHLFTIFGVYGDVVRVKLAPAQAGHVLLRSTPATSGSQTPTNSGGHSGQPSVVSSPSSATSPGHFSFASAPTSGSSTPSMVSSGSSSAGSTQMQLSSLQLGLGITTSLPSTESGPSSPTNAREVQASQNARAADQGYAEGQANHGAGGATGKPENLGVPSTSTSTTHSPNFIPSPSSSSSLPSLQPSTALVQFMSREQALLALTHLEGVRILGPNSRPMKLSIAQVASISMNPLGMNTGSGRGGLASNLSSTDFLSQTPALTNNHSAPSVPSRGNSLTPTPSDGGAQYGASSHNYSSSASSTAASVMLRDYAHHAGHRFKYMSSKNSRHICAPCGALHLSGLALEVGEDDLRAFFTGVFSRTLDPVSCSTAIRSLTLFGGEGKRMAFLVLSSTEQAILALVFGHNVKIRGKYMRMTFSHAKEHQNHGGGGGGERGHGSNRTSPTLHAVGPISHHGRGGDHQQQQQQQLQNQLQVNGGGGLYFGVPPPHSQSHTTPFYSPNGFPLLSSPSLTSALAGGLPLGSTAGGFPTAGPLSTMPGAFTPDMLLAIQAQLAGLGFAQQGQPGGMLPPQMASPHLVPPMSHGGQSSLTSSPANYQSTISITLPMLTDTVMGMTTSPVYPSATKSAQVQPTLTPASTSPPPSREE